VSTKRRDNPIRVNTYLPGALVERIKRYAEKLAAENPTGREVAQSDAIAILLSDALARANVK